MVRRFFAWWWEGLIIMGQTYYPEIEIREVARVFYGPLGPIDL